MNRRHARIALGMTGCIVRHPKLLRNSGIRKIFREEWAGVFSLELYRLRRLALLARMIRQRVDEGHVYVSYSHYCCDTGRFGLTYRYDDVLEAWRSTSHEALCDASDGPSYAGLASREDYDLDRG